MFLAVIFCFADLKVKDTKYRMLSDRFELSTPNYVKASEKDISLKCRAKLNVSLSPGYMSCTDLNTTQHIHTWVQKT